MKDLIRIIWVSIFLTGAAVASGTDTVEVAPLAISDVTVEPDTAAGKITVAMRLNTTSYSLPSEAEVIITPVLKPYGAESRLQSPVETLPSIYVAGRTRYFRHLRNGDVAPGDTLVRSGAKGELRYLASVPYESAGDSMVVFLSVEGKGCCSTVSRRESLPLASVNLKPALPRLVTDSIETEEEFAVVEQREKEIKGTAFIDFRVNRTEIDPLYRKNPFELQKISETINRVAEIPGARITSVTIHGYASPEGKYEANQRLARGRAKSLAEYVKGKHHLADSIFHHESTPEDWKGLRDTVAALDLPDSMGILEIIDSNRHPDDKDAEIRRRFPRTYSFLLQEIYPALRHSDYSVKYNVKGYSESTHTRMVSKAVAREEKDDPMRRLPEPAVTYLPCETSVKSFLRKW